MPIWFLVPIGVLKLPTLEKRVMKGGHLLRPLPPLSTQLLKRYLKTTGRFLSPPRIFAFVRYTLISLGRLLSLNDNKIGAELASIVGIANKNKNKKIRRNK
jgi:hypothetical protein